MRSSRSAYVRCSRARQRPSSKTEWNRGYRGLDHCLDKTRREGRDAQTSGRCSCVGFGGWICLTPNDRDGSWWHGHATSDGHARRAQWGFWCTEKAVSVYGRSRCVLRSDRNDRCRDGRCKSSTHRRTPVSCRAWTRGCDPWLRAVLRCL